MLGSASEEQIKRTEHITRLSLCAATGSVPATKLATAALYLELHKEQLSHLAMRSMMALAMEESR